MASISTRSSNDHNTPIYRSVSVKGVISSHFAGSRCGYSSRDRRRISHISSSHSRRSMDYRLTNSASGTTTERPASPNSMSTVRRAGTLGSERRYFDHVTAPGTTTQRINIVRLVHSPLLPSLSSCQTNQAKDSPQDHLAWTARRTASPCARTRNVATTASRLTRFSLYDAKRLVSARDLLSSLTFIV
jgi:hypothetical protein